METNIFSKQSEYVHNENENVTSELWATAFTKSSLSKSSNFLVRDFQPTAHEPTLADGPPKLHSRLQALHRQLPLQGRMLLCISRRIGTEIGGGGGGQAFVARTPGVSLAKILLPLRRPFAVLCDIF